MTIARWLVTNRANALGCTWWYFGGLFIGKHWPFWWLLVASGVYLAASAICTVVAGPEEGRA